MNHLHTPHFDQTTIGRVRLQFFTLRLWRWGMRYQEESWVGGRSRVLALPFMAIRVNG